ncbi:MAG TPA: hypothetical protein VGR14_12005 [Verrucomicrobiae bacterium]|nr:hypothetical protein [Verrucomicrobiae bacterium]
MSEQEQERFEAELRRTQPAPVPRKFMDRLQAADPSIHAAQRGRRQPATEWTHWWRLARWLAPALAAVAVAFLIGHANSGSKSNPADKPLVAAAGLKANDVQVDHELVSSFDVVATLPGGEPVRFRCRKWKDQLLVTDKSSGVEIEQNSPRIEVMPVRFETY